MSDHPPFGPDAVTSSGVRRAEDVCDHFEAAWKGAAATGPPRIETHLALVPEGERPAVLVELIALDMDYRQRAGECPCLQDYQARFPSFQLESLPSTLTPAPPPAPPPSGRQTTSVVDAGKPAGPPVTRIRCPNCHNPIDLADDRPDEVLCPGCGSSFRVREARQTTTEARMRPLGKFQLLERVGLGAFGAVWRAKDMELDRVVALKIPHASLLQSEADLERFHREARAAAQLRHPGIVTVHEVQVLEGLPTLVSDFIEGVSLRDFLEVRKLTFRESAVLLAEVAEAVDYAHSMGLVHRDIKPANIMVDRSPTDAGEATRDGLKGEPRPLGRPLIMDFGLALRQEAEVTLTLDGHIIGTPAYMSPEQASGKGHQADRRSDVYSLGVMLYELLTGELPFRGSKMMILHQVLTEEPRPPRKLNDKIPRDLETVCLKALEKEPGGRYQTARALAEELRRWLRGEPIQERPAGAWERGWKWARRRPAVAALLLVSGIAALALVGLVVGLWHTTALQSQKERAQEASALATEAQRVAVEAREEANKALNEQKTASYFNRIVLAERAWLTNNVGYADKLLDDCRAELRGGEWEWRYLKRLCHAERLTLPGHTDQVWAVMYSPDGKLIASAGDDTVRLWNATTGQLIRPPLPLHNVAGAAFSPDGKWIAATSGTVPTKPGDIKVWETTTGKELFSRPLHTSGGRGAAFSPDARLLALGASNGTILFLETKTGREVGNPIRASETEEITAVAFSSNGRKLAASTGTLGNFAIDKRPGRVQFWNVETRQLDFDMPGHKGPVTCVAFSSDDKYLASSSWDQTVKVWDLGTRKVVYTLRGHTQFVNGVAFSPKGRFLASASEDETVKVWDLDTGLEAFTIRGHTGLVNCVAYSPDGEQLASGSEDFTVKVWNLSTIQEASTLRQHGAWVTSVAFNHDGRRMASASIDGIVRVWKVEGSRVTPDPDLASLRGHKGPVWCVVFSPDGRYLASASGDWTKPDFPAEVKIWNARTGDLEHNLPVAKGVVWSVAFSPDGKHLASGGGEFDNAKGELAIWDAHTGRQERVFGVQPKGISSVAYSPNGRCLASASQTTVTTWDVTTGDVIRTFRGHESQIHSVTFSPDGERLASASMDKTVRIWDVKTGEEIFKLIGHTNFVMNAAFSPDGKRLASASTDQTVKLWEMTSGKEVLTHCCKHPCFKKSLVSVDAGVRPRCDGPTYACVLPSPESDAAVVSHSRP